MSHTLHGKTEVAIFETSNCHHQAILVHLFVRTWRFQRGAARQMAHQAIPVHSSGRTTRQHSQTYRAEQPTTSSTITSLPYTAFQLDIDKLSKGLGSVDLQENNGAPAKTAQFSPSTKAVDTVKSTTSISNAAGAIDSATNPQNHQQPPIVRRSRRGEKAISHHPQVGRYRVEITSSERLWCGKFALGISTEQQLGTRLTIEDFDEIFAGEESRAFNEKHGWVGVDGIASNFYDEQLDLVLRVWGRRHGMQLRLGVVRDFEGVFVNGASGDEETDERKEVGGCTTLWVHNDNAMLLGRPFNHYSGISVLNKA